jgi:hypothetical protein
LFESCVAHFFSWERNLGPRHPLDRAHCRASLREEGLLVKCSPA